MLPSVWKGNGGGCCCTGGGTPCLICVHAHSCPGANVSGATFTVKQGSTTIGTCTTDASGNCCVDVTSTGTGTYQVYISKTGYTGSNATISVTCPGTTNVDLLIANSGAETLRILSPCGPSNLDGATLTINGGTYVSSGGGLISIVLPNGSYPYTISYPPRFVDITGTAVVAGCGITGIGGNMTMSIASGYHCGFGCIQPLADTLFLTDSRYGPFTLTYNGTNLDWEGGGSVSVPAICSQLGFPCPAASSTLTYLFGGAGGSIVQYTGIRNIDPNAYCPKPPVGNYATYGVVSASDSLTCPPSAFSYSWFPTACALHGAIYDGSETITVTE